MIAVAVILSVLYFTLGSLAIVGWFKGWVSGTWLDALIAISLMYGIGLYCALSAAGGLPL